MLLLRSVQKGCAPIETFETPQELFIKCTYIVIQPTAYLNTTCLYTISSEKSGCTYIIIFQSKCQIIKVCVAISGVMVKGYFCHENRITYSRWLFTRHGRCAAFQKSLDRKTPDTAVDNMSWVRATWFFVYLRGKYPAINFKWVPIYTVIKLLNTVPHSRVPI